MLESEPSSNSKAWMLVNGVVMAWAKSSKLPSFMLQDLLPHVLTSLCLLCTRGFQYQPASFMPGNVRVDLMASVLNFRAVVHGPSKLELVIQQLHVLVSIIYQPFVASRSVTHPTKPHLLSEAVLAFYSIHTGQRATMRHGPPLVQRRPTAQTCLCFQFLQHG